MPDLAEYLKSLGIGLQDLATCSGVLNPALILKQRRTVEDIEALKLLHGQKSDVFKQMQNSNDPVELRRLAKEFDELEFTMQKAWGFPQDENHHEWYSGAGYPHRLRGREIPIGARIVSIADAYDTIRQAGGRYKETRDLQWAVGELINCSGTQFDPEVLAHFIQVLIEKGELQPNTYDQRKLEESLKSVMA